MATQNDPTSIKELFQGLIPDAVSPLQGKVTSVSPLQIQVDNDDKLTLNASILIVPRHLTNYTATVDIVQGLGTVTGNTAEDGSHAHNYSGTASGESGDVDYSGTTEAQTHQHDLAAANFYGATMTVYNALKVGDKVHLLSLNKAKKYYILDRVV